MVSKMKIERITRGITQYDIEQKTGIRQNVVSLIERGYKEPSTEEVKAIARAIGVPEDSIFSEPQAQDAVGAGAKHQMR